MNLRWGLYVAAFVIGTFILITGFIQGDAALVLVGVAIGIGLYFSRGYIQ